ncbi:UbiA prenyltransferase family protein [Lentzea albidocapillata]|uniref:4-hydroxybenzoate polyprenyltransferase n=1 Tax=Lentzea albidocapillata TaxID=40571 RepID=A0A1W2FMQ8_9PSEU|nr:UbiA family prenyltransferase [Lentzea albidocapillata]SMD23225.1 4-hydroxybenzoate polyprenyltransferase [Lentzea albidocapillata]
MPALTYLHRLEHPFGVHYACAASWGACYATRFDLAVVIAVLANFVAIISGNPLNAYTDVRNDIHTTDKRHLARAVQEIGARKVLALAIFEMIFALALAVAVSWKVAIGVGLVLVLYLAYNLEPIRLKRRGYAGPVVLAIAAGLLPSVTAYAAAGGEAEPAVWLVFSGVAALATGRALWWAVPDRAGDARVGSRTPAVLYGTRHAVNATIQLTVGGLLLVGGGLWFRFGLFWAAVGVVACSAFLLARDLPTARQQLRYGMSMAVVSTIVLAAIPLLA